MPRLQDVPPKRTNLFTSTVDPGWSRMPTRQAPRANPSSKGTSLISRLPLHYIILLDQEFLTVETWCGFWYGSSKGTLPEDRKLDWIFADAGALQKTSHSAGNAECLPQLVCTVSQFYTNSTVHLRRPKYACFVAVKENRKLFQSFHNAFSIQDQRCRLREANLSIPIARVQEY